jgi:uncharacterized protein YggE
MRCRRLTLPKEIVVRIALFSIALLTAAPVFAQGPAPPAAPTVVVGGEGVVQAVPDRAWINVGVESRAQNPRDAQRRNTEVMAPVIAKLKAAGIPDEAIRTIGYDLQLEWDYVNNKRVARGYVARNTVEVRVDNIDRLGELLEIAVGSGATTLGGIRFDLKDRATVEAQALRRAVADARSKAEAVAAAAGQAIDRVVRIEEQGVSSGPPPRPMFREAQLAAADASVPISAGEIEIRANVAITATLK